MKVLQELEELPKHWGCCAETEVTKKFNGDIDSHIEDILERNKEEYITYTRDYGCNGDYYNVYSFSFIDVSDELYAILVEIEYC